MSGKTENAPKPDFSIQNILSPKNLDGIWSHLLTSEQLTGDNTKESNSSSTEWENEALDMRMNQIPSKSKHLFVVYTIIAKLDYRKDLFSCQDTS